MKEKIGERNGIPVAAIVVIHTYDDISLFEKGISAEELMLKLRLGANPNVVNEKKETL